MVARSIKTAGQDADEIEPTIVVLPNCRTGLFGWLGGETVAADGTLNAGLLDQKLALDWVQKFIHLFGGDAQRVTVIGESAGAGSIMFHITANGGSGEPIPFSRAIMQSPTFYPRPPNDPRPENITQSILALTKSTTLNDLREIPSSILQKVNKEVVGELLYGLFTFGPLVDGCYIPDLPGRLLLEGKFHHNVQIMLGHNFLDSFIFISLFLTNTTSAFNQQLIQQFPEASAHVIQEI